jgi:hypothetical protein
MKAETLFLNLHLLAGRNDRTEIKRHQSITDWLK